MLTSRQAGPERAGAGRRFVAWSSRASLGTLIAKSRPVWRAPAGFRDQNRLSQGSSSRVDAQKRSFHPLLQAFAPEHCSTTVVVQTEEEKSAGSPSAVRHANCDGRRRDNTIDYARHKSIQAACMHHGTPSCRCCKARGSLVDGK